MWLFRYVLPTLRRRRRLWVKVSISNGVPRRLCFCLAELSLTCLVTFTWFREYLDWASFYSLLWQVKMIDSRRDQDVLVQISQASQNPPETRSAVIIPPFCFLSVDLTSAARAGWPSTPPSTPSRHDMATHWLCMRYVEEGGNAYVYYEPGCTVH